MTAVHTTRFRNEGLIKIWVQLKQARHFYVNRIYDNTSLRQDKIENGPGEAKTFARCKVQDASQGSQRHKNPTAGGRKPRRGLKLYRGQTAGNPDWASSCTVGKKTAEETRLGFVPWANKNGGRLGWELYRGQSGGKKAWARPDYRGHEGQIKRART